MNNRGKSFFVKAYDSSGHQKTSENLVAICADGIDYVGASNVVQFISDSDASNIRARLLLEDKYPNIFWTPCVAHGLKQPSEGCRRPTLNRTYDSKREGCSYIYILSSLLPCPI